MPSFLNERAAARLRDKSPEQVMATLRAIAEARAGIAEARHRKEMAQVEQATWQRRLGGLQDQD